MAIVTRIDTQGINSYTRRLRTCAYCRVSSNSEDQLNSYSNQMRYYRKKIQENEEWEFVDVFADEGITGTRADIRSEFQRMINLCNKGKIDFIITKSISRFARNVPECLEYARKLKRNGIGIYFEKESINTLGMTDEFMLSTFSAIAQEESFAISQRLRHANVERMKRGEYVAGTCPFGYRMENKKLVVYEPEAEIVRKLFELYLSGASINELARDMTNEKIEKKNGYQWHYCTIAYILTNEKYIGDTLLQKTFKTDTLPFQKRKNKGEKDQYYVHESHQAIITREVFERVQKILKEKSKYYNKNKEQKTYPLSKSIICEECGSFFIRRTSKENVVWSCYSHERGKENCPAKRYREDDIYKAYLRMFNKLYTNRKVVLQQMLTQLDYVIKYKKRTNEIIQEHNRNISFLLDKKMMIEQLKNKGLLTEEMYYHQSKEIEQKMCEIKAERYMMFDSELEETYSNIKNLMDVLDEYGNEMSKFESEVFDKIVVETSISNDNQITFKIMGGLKLKERL